MKNPSQHSMKPSTLRLLLALSLFTIAGLSVGGFVLVQQKISTFAVEVSHKKVDAAASKASLQTLQRIEKELTANREIVDKADNIRHVSDLPQFKAIDDIRNLAAANNLELSNITFTATNATTAGSTPATTPGAAAPITSAATPGTTTADVQGVDITFDLGQGAIKAADFINFLYDIEHTTPKMQAQGIGVSAGGGASDIKVEQMTVKMFTKKPGQQ